MSRNRTRIIDYGPGSAVGGVGSDGAGELEDGLVKLDRIVRHIKVRYCVLPVVAGENKGILSGSTCKKVISWATAQNIIPT